MSSESAIRRLIKFDGSCCMSCHDDEEYGIDMREVELGKGRISYLCCTVLEALKEYQKSKTINE